MARRAPRPAAKVKTALPRLRTRGRESAVEPEALEQARDRDRGGAGGGDDSDQDGVRRVNCSAAWAGRNRRGPNGMRCSATRQRCGV